jgi:hypothetical protein
MARKTQAKLLILAVATVTSLALPLFYNNCGGQVNFGQGAGKLLGTVTGNPLGPASRGLVERVCAIITQCDSRVTYSSCEAGVSAVGGIDSELGLQSGRYENLDSITLAEQAGAIVSQPAATSTCYAEFDRLSCSDASVRNAYDPSLPNPFVGFPSMIPQTSGSCPSMFSTPVGKPEYFVATTGNDNNDGSSTRPWATITHASQALVPGPSGAIVHVAPGTYAQTTTCSSDSLFSGSIVCGVSTQQSGASASARILYISDQKWGAKLAPVGSFSVWHNRASYIDIVGFEFIGDAASHAGFHNEVSNVNVMGNHIHDVPANNCAPGFAGSIGGQGIYHGSSVGVDNNTIANVVHDIGEMHPDGTPWSQFCNDVGGIHYNGPRGNIHNNIVYRIEETGIMGYHSATDLNISNNLVFNVGFINDSGAPYGSGIQIRANDPGAVHDNTTVANNIIRDIKGTALLEGGSTGPNNVYLNNLLFSNPQEFSLQNGLVAKGTVRADPKLVKFQVNGGGDYHLQLGSPAIDAAITSCAPGKSACMPLIDADGFARPFGPALDIGPFEWHP